MAIRYDTDAIFEAARMVSSVASDVQSSCREVGKINTSVNDVFEGDAANAFKFQLSDLNSDLQKLRNGLNSISNELRRYAIRLQEADAEAASKF
ncbi:MAG: WXG100 family type VII secretion target [Clostridia bacterium]|nr:WXG100 family type VII secretion target [Clostridia bacterium]